MIYAIFIAKDNSEFDCYPGEMPYLDASKQRKSQNGQAEEREEKKLDKTQKIYDVDVADLKIIVLNRSDAVNKIREDQENSSDADCNAFFDFIINKIHCKEDDSVFVFCHWGNGGSRESVLGLDTRITDRIKSFFKNYSDGKFENWRINAISSRRPEIFAVAGVDHEKYQSKYGIDSSKMPKTIENVEELANLLEEERIFNTFECLPDDLKIDEKHEKTIDFLKNNKIAILIIPVANLKILDYIKRTIEQFLVVNDVDLLNIQSDIKFFPLFLDCKFYFDDHTYNAIEESGLSVPKEFTFCFSKKKNNVDSKGDIELTQELINSLFERIEIWSKDDELKEGITKSTLREWMAGAFRKYLFQDEHVHGANSTLDIFSLKDKKNIPHFIKHWIKGERVNEKDISAKDDQKELKKRLNVPSNEGLWSILQKIYNEEIERIRNCFNYVDKNVDKIDDIKSFKTDDKIEKVIQLVFRNSDKQDGIFDGSDAPQTFEDIVDIQQGNIWGEGQAGSIIIDKGLASKFVSPTLKFNVLVIDDNENSARDLNGNSILKDVFHFYQLPVGIQGKNNIVEIVECIIKEIHKINQCSYDFVLLDLSFGEDPGSDLTGYHLIPVIHQFFPQMPIIIYSQFSDMGHIARAFRCGAKWFLKRGDEVKLPRHILSIMRRIEWEKEWKVVNQELWKWKQRKTETDGQKKFQEVFKNNKKLQYLVYKSLEKYPGINVDIDPMGEGFSTAVTFQAVKCEEGKKPLQTPVIIKIDSVYNTRLEYERYFRFIRPYIANRTGRIEEPELVLDDENSAIVYTFAGRQSERYDLNTMSTLLKRDIKNRSSCNFESYGKAFEIILSDILPRIHRVKPSLEFNNKSFKIDKTPSGFPNRFFGEKKVENGKGEQVSSEDFLANWLCRMPICRKLEEFNFIAQNENEKSHPHYEFNKKAVVNGKCVIEAYDFDDKCKVTMTGQNVDHVVKYRPYIYPCMTLWVDKWCDGEIILEDSIPTKTINAIKKINIELTNGQAINEFANLVKKLIKDPVNEGRPSDKFYIFNGDGTSDEWEGVFNGLDDKSNTAFNALPALFKVAQKLLEGELKDKLKDCPAGIVHGDMNYSNIMLETEKRFLGRDVFSDEIPEVKDVWLIDFARTRRDLIAHDFNVMFTSTLALLFDLDVWSSEELLSHDFAYQSFKDNPNKGQAHVHDIIAYHNFIEEIFREFIVRAVFDKLDATPDFIENDKRLSFIFRILRRIRMAALKAGMSEESYAFTTALSCMVASHVYIDHEESANAPAAAAMIASALICFAKLKKIEGDC